MTSPRTRWAFPLLLFLLTFATSGALASPESAPSSAAASSSSSSSSSLVSDTLSSYAPFGKIKFVSSCGGPDQRRRLNDGLALLHSFWYEEVHVPLQPREEMFARKVNRRKSFSMPLDKAREVFRSLTVEVKNCAMGHWGIAMSYLQPLWSYPTPADLQAGQEALRKARLTLNDPKVTELEKGHIWALEGYFAEDQTIPYATRILRWESRMEKLWQTYPKDTETTVFYALALKSKSLIVLEAEGGKIHKNLETADESSDEATIFYYQRRAGKLLELVLLEERYHPGALHYLIHSYDYPLLAHKALPYAKRYALAAPLVAHALHMPAHIFVRLGNWREAIESDTKSMNVSLAYFQRKIKEGKASEGMYDEYLHSLDYLIYSHHQIGQDKIAIDYMREVLNTTSIYPGLSHGSVYSLISSTARSFAETHDWNSLAKLEFPPALAQDIQINAGSHVGDWAHIFKLYLRSIGLSYRFTQIEHLESEQAQIEATQIRKEMESLLKAMQTLSVSARLARELSEDLSVLWRITVDVQVGVAQAMVDWVEGRRDDAVIQLAYMADKEDSYFKPSVKPSVIYPVREHLADKLMIIGRTNAALRAYKDTLKQQPLRFNSLLGAAKATRALKRDEESSIYYTLLLQQITGCVEVKHIDLFAKNEGLSSEDLAEENEYQHDEELEDCIYRFMVTHILVNQSFDSEDDASTQPYVGDHGIERRRYDELAEGARFMHEQRLLREERRRRRLARLREGARGNSSLPSSGASMITVEMWAMCFYLLLSALLGFASSQAVTHYRKKNN